MMEAKTVDKLERALEKAIADAVLKRGVKS